MLPSSLLTSYDPFAGVLAVIGVLSAGLAALGVYGLVEFGRRGSITWLVPTITIAADARRAVNRTDPRPATSLSRCLAVGPGGMLLL